MLQLGHHHQIFFTERWVDSPRCVPLPHLPHVRWLYKAAVASASCYWQATAQLWDVPVTSPGHPLPILNLLQKASYKLLGKDGIRARLKIGWCWRLMIPGCLSWRISLGTRIYSILSLLWRSRRDEPCRISCFSPFCVIICLPLTFSFFMEPNSSI